MEHVSIPERLDLRYEQLLRYIGAREQVGRAEAERLAAAVVEALELRLSAGEAKQLEAELPLPMQRLLRRHLRSAERHGGRHEAPRTVSQAELLQAVAGRLDIPLDLADAVTRAVFEGLRLILSPREIADIASQLGPDIRQRWLGHPAKAPIKLSVPPEPVDPGPEGYQAYLDDLRSSGLLESISPEDATRAVFGLFLHRISGGEAHRLLDELPEGMRDLLGAEVPAKEAQAAVFGREELVRWVCSRLAVDEVRADSIIRAVFAAARLHCSEEQAARVAGQLPYELRTVWFRPAVPPLVSPEEYLDTRLEQVLGHVRRALGCDEAGAWTITAHVLCQLERRMAGGEARRLNEQLPWRLRELMLTCRPPAEKPASPTSARSLVEGVQQRLGLHRKGAEAAIQAVFDAVRAVISPQQSRQVSSELPSDLKALWMGRSAER